LTKVDKLSKTKRKKQQRIISDALFTREENLILFSAKTRLGKEVLWNAIEHAAYGNHKK